MGRAHSKSRDRLSGAVTAAVLSGAAAALAAVAATEFSAASEAVPAAAGGATAVVTYLAVRLVVVRPARARVRSANQLVLDTQRELRERTTDRAARRDLEVALDRAEDEPAVLDVSHDALARRFPDRAIELHLVDPVDPVLVVSIAIGRPAGTLGQKSSPWEPRAARSDTTLVYESTQSADVCSHVQTRAGEPSSAVAIPLTASGRILGLLYVFGPDGQTPDPAEIALLEELAATISAHVAIHRVPEVTARSDSIDRVTGLPDRPAMQDHVLGLLGQRTPFTVAVVDVDDLAALVRERGRVVADEALAMLARVSRRAIRPDDLVGRVGDDELLFVMPDTDPPDAARAIERIREELFVSQSVADVAPRFTISAGVVGAPTGLTIDAIMKTAAATLQSARNGGGNRILIGEPVSELA